jgi:hypothetical protein
VCKTSAENLRHQFKGIHPWRLVYREFGVNQKIITMIAILVCVEDQRKTKAKKNKKKDIQYPSQSSAIRPVPHGLDIPVRPAPHGLDIPVRPVPHGPDIPVPSSPLPQTEIFSRSYAKDDEVHSSSGTEIKISQLLNQSELNNLVRDLDFTKEKRELLGTRPKNNFQLQEQTSTAVEIMRKRSRNSS